jgi:hypothetical protein
MSDWTPTETMPPPENVVVDAMDSGGHVQRLVRSGRLYFVEDRSMYVYFTPTHWKLP